MKADVLIIGAGPGGYPAAFRLAGEGRKVIVVDSDENPGGVCLQRGCIPSKALLHAGSILESGMAAADLGIKFAKPEIDLGALRNWRDNILTRHSAGLRSQFKQLGIELVRGRAKLLSPQTALVQTLEKEEQIEFGQLIMATGSSPIDPGLGVGHSRIMDSTGALALPDVPGSLLVVGGGYIGLELGQAYANLGSKVTVVEMSDSLLPGVDRDLARVLEKRLRQQFESVLTNTKVVSAEPDDDKVLVRLEGNSAPAEPLTFERVLVAVGRRPNSSDLGLENTAIKLDQRGFIITDERQQTDQPGCYAIGDVAGQPMLAHKATHQGLVAADAILGVRSAAFDPVAIPAVVFTDPELAWCGRTEAVSGETVRTGRFNWAASGRASTIGRTDGITKIVCDHDTGRIIGVGIVGPGAGELIGEAVLAMEMGAVAEDLARTIHAHPTLSETIMEAAASISCL